MRFLLTSFFLACIALPVYATEPLPDYQANYLVELSGIQAGELVQTLSTDEAGNRQLLTKSQAKGVFAYIKPDVIEEKSLWAYHNEQVRPEFYRYSRTGGDKDKQLTMDFYWDKKQVHINDEQQPWDLDLQKKTVDKHVYQLQLMHDLQNEIETLQYSIADGGTLKNYQIVRQDEEVIKTPLGKINTIKLTRERDDDSERQTTLWCAPELNYLPVKLEHIEKDNTRFTAYLRKLEGISTEPFITEATE